MTGPIYDQIEQRTAEFRRKRGQIADIERQLEAAQTTVTSKNRMISVAVSSRGEVMDIKFRTESYRTMPGAELSQLLVETIKEARQQALATVAEMFQVVLPDLPLMEMMSGKIDLDAMMSKVIPDVDVDGPAAYPRAEGADRG
ncbi:YbaB/EbfC family nucleoid-associated protein [Catellatospora citrea]|uniref:DNA-binding protein YbaB n=1 Tax=Catellatospora citrea TaxID=53366 RepID=A0A8J3P473_9ACTN|nr:YbaB/EbfC family nucleoid-associated protein [Catellatospora citrea]RKE10668.1 DNA-binding protein YbaB [Catellatospora citrea]GIG03079.1 hypothetical protein Cci01nite_81720 [Catellatospora citrea]